MFPQQRVDLHQRQMYYPHLLLKQIEHHLLYLLFHCNLYYQNILFYQNSTFQLQLGRHRHKEK